MSADLPAGSPSGSDPVRRPGVTIRGLVKAVVAVALPLGLFINLGRYQGRVASAASRAMALGDRIREVDPSLARPKLERLEVWSHPLGGGVDGRYRLVTPARREVTIALEFRAGLLRDGPNRVTFASGGRSVTWPFEDLDRGRKVDLRAMFPEAFR